MKKCYFLSVIFQSIFTTAFLLFMSIYAKAQTDIAIGTGTSGNSNFSYPCPIQDYYEGSRAQYLYTAAELAAAGMGPGNINAIRFNVTDVNGAGVVEKYSIKMGTTSVNSLDLNSWIAGGTIVLPQADYQPLLGLNSFTFTTPFFWNGSDNIIVEVCNGDPNNASAVTYTNNVSVPWTENLSFNGSHTYRADNEGNLCNTNSTDNTGNETSRPNIIFNWTMAAPCTGTPNAGTISTSTNNTCLGQPFTLTTTGVTIASGLTFQWQSSTDNINWTPIPGATSFSYTGTQLVTTYYRFYVSCGASSATTSTVLISSPPLVSGTFTINNTAPTGGTNFQSFNDAYNFMKCGINGPVIFNVLNGPYNEQLIMKSIPGASEINTVTFKGNGHSIGFASTNSISRAVIKLDSVNHIIFDSLVINATSGTYGFGVQLIRNSDSNVVRNCTINIAATSVSQNFAGIVINGSDAGAVVAGRTVCDYNTFENNTINGGYYGITLVASQSGANGFNSFTGNTIKDFYQYGFYVSGSYNTVFEGNAVSRPSRVAVGSFYGVYFSGLNTLASISKNRITNPFGGLPTSAGAFYGITFENVNTPATYDNVVVNNLVVSNNGNGVAYGISNNGSDNISYFHNTISIDFTTSTSFSATRGFSETLGDDGVYFLDNIVSISRGGTAIKHCIYLGSSTSTVISDYNNLYIGSVGGSTNAIGYNGSNRTTLVNWRAATNHDLYSVSTDPVYVDVTTGNYKPQNAGFDNRGAYIGIDTDIEGTVRSQSTPDMGAYEFVPPPCIAPPLPGTTLFNYTTTTDTVLCVNVALQLGLRNNSYGFTQTFQWQTSTSLAGPYTMIGNPMPAPDTMITSSTTLYYRCAVTCGNSTVYSNPLKLTVNPALPAGTYTINFGSPTTWPGGTNFKTFNDAKASMNCGVAGPVIFNVVSGTGPYEEQLKLDSIPGTSSVNTVTFMGNGNTLHYSSSNTNEKAVIKLSHASHIIFDSLKIDATGAGSNGFGVHLINNADSNTFRKCTILTSDVLFSTSYAGIVISGSDASASSIGSPNCDGNLFDGNKITGGYYGIVAVANSTSTIKGNRFSNNLITDFYNYGIYLGVGNSGTAVTGNSITRPSRPTAASLLYGVYSTGTGTRNSISKNRIYNLLGGSPTSAATTYGIYHKDANATSGNADTVANNLLYKFSGSGPVYAVANDGSSYVSYYHNTISVDNTANGFSLARGFYLNSDPTGIQFKNNIITITSAGSGTKYATYVSEDAEIEEDYNDYYVNAGGTQNYVGFLGSNQATLADWKAATTQETHSFSIDPVYADPANNNYAPVVAPFDNQGTPVNISADILGVSRSNTTPDIGAYEFTVPTCSGPTANTATVTPSGGICVDVPVTFDIPGTVSAAGLKFIWQNAGSATGPWTDISDSLYLARFVTGARATPFYRAAIVCNGTVTYTNVLQISMNPLLLAGTYTINKNPPAGTTKNFLSFTDAVNALACGITGPIIFNVVPDTYTEQVTIGKVPGISAINNVTFTSENGVANSVKLTYNSTLAPANYVLKFDSASHLIFKNITITSTSALYGRAVEFAGSSSFDSLLNCVIVAPAAASSSLNLATVYASGLSGQNVVIKGNAIRNGSSGIYLAGTSPTRLSPDHLIDSNTVSGFYNYGIYAGFTSHVRLTRNTVTMTSPAAPISYGVYATTCDNGYHVTSNNIKINNVAGSAVYGIYVTNSEAPLNDSGIIANNTVVAGSGNTASVYGLTNYNSSGNFTLNNVIAVKSAGSTAYGLYSFNANDVNYYNNSVNISVPLAANSYAAYFNHTTASSNVKIKNNIFSNKGSGKALYINNPTLFTGDYNTLYTAGTTLVQVGSPAAGFTTLKAWSNAYYWDINSIVYSPAFVNDTLLLPDLANSDVWAIHGRGVQIAGNNYDFNNHVRPVALTEGVPDMGAYEFLPTALPTVLTAIPASPAAGQAQSFMYGTDTVMKITWGATAPSSVAVRRFSGVVPAGLTPGIDSMYFYTSVEIPGGGSYPYSIQQFYIDPWQGSIDDQHSIGLGKTTPSNSWVVGFSSTVDVNKNVISQSNLDYIDKFTGLVNPYAPPVGPDRDSSNRGKRFWVGYAKSWDFTSGQNAQEMVLYLSTDQQAANVQVKINGTTYVRNYVIPPNTVKVSDLIPKSGPSDARLFDEGFYNRGISITSDVPIVAYAHIYSTTNSGATMLMPTGVYGYEYYTLNSLQNYTDTSAYSSFFVVSDNDNTQVEITPSNPTLKGRPANVPFVVTLNKGEVYQVLGAIIQGSEGYDLTGSKVKSIANSGGKCFPIAVFAGSTRTALGCGSDVGSSGDVIFQQIFPSQAWGKRYLTAPTSTGNAPGSFMTNIYRVMVKDPTTVVKRNNVVLTNLMSNRYYPFESNTADIIESDKPVLVAQYMSSSSSCPNTDGDGDPEMFYLSPVEQAVNYTGFYRNTLSEINENYVTMVLPTNGMNSLTIDGVAWASIPAAQKFSYVHPNAPEYSVAIKRWSGTPGQSIVKSDSSFTGIVYGLGSVESYGYNMGTLVKNLQAVGSITNSLSSSGNANEFTCANSPFRFTAKLPLIPTSLTWNFSRTPTSPNRDTTFQNPVPEDTISLNGVTYYTFSIGQDYSFPAPGVYGVPITYSNPDIESCDHSREDIIYVQVLPAPKTDFNVTFSGCSGDQANFVADSLTENGIKVTSWKWIFHDSTSSQTVNTSFTYPTPGTYKETLRTITADGCIGDTSKPVLVNLRPVVEVVDDSLVICSGTDTAFSVLNPVDSASYTWYTALTGGTAAASGPRFPVANVTDTMYYYVEGMQSGCTSLARKEVVVTPLPTLPKPVVTVDFASIDSVRFRWNAVPSAIGYEVSLDSGATFITPSSGSTGLTHTITSVTPLQQISIIVRALGTEACENSVSDIVSVCIAARVEVVNDSIPICSDSSVTFQVLSPVSGVVYSWYADSTGGAAIATGSAFTVDNVAAEDSYFVEGVSAAGCNSGRTKVTVTVAAKLASPVAVLDVASGDSVRFKWNAVPFAIGYQVSLDSGRTFITPSSGPTGLTHTITGVLPLQQVSIIVKALGNIDCQNSISDTVSACLIQAVSVANGSVSTCTDSTVVFHVQSPVAGVVYSWYNAATGGSALATGPDFTVTGVSADAAYYVEGISSAGCNSGRTKVMISVSPLIASPVVRFDSTIVGANTLVFNWAAVPGATGYEVSVNGGPYIVPSSGATGLSHTVTGLAPFQQVTLQVRALGTQPCQTSLPGSATGSTRTNMVFIPNTFTPNGDGRNDRLMVYSNVIRSMKMMIFNQWGEKVFETESQQTGWDGSYKGKPQPVGVYVYVSKITLTDGSVIEKKGSINLIR